MHNVTREDKKLLFKYEVLRARLEIREFFLKTSVREVYENIGQVLSLVRMQLASFDLEEIEVNTEDIVQSGHLVGQSIRDLRSMCRSFYPDLDILKEGGFTEALESTLQIIGLSTGPVVKIKGFSHDISEGLKLIVFKMIQDILVLIKEIKGVYKSIVVSYAEEGIAITIRYKGDVPDWNKKNITDHADSDLSLLQRVQLIEADFYARESKTGITSIILKIPLNPLYE